MQQPDVENLRSTPDLETPNLEEEKLSLSVPQSNSRPPIWSLLGLGILITFAGLGVAAFLWLVAMPPVPKCEEISNLSSDRDRLSCAQLAAESKDPEKVLAALTLVGSWSAQHPLRQEGQALAAHWSRVLMEQARKKAEANDVETAIALLEKVPPNNPEYAAVQEKLTQWQQSWQQGQAIWKDAETALRSKEWTKATREADKLSGIQDEYWRLQRFGELIRRIAAEKQGWRQLDLAEKAAKQETVLDYQRAVKLASQIDGETFAKAEAKPKLEVWSRVLLNKATEFKQTGDLTRAIDLAETIPTDMAVRDAAQQLIQLARAESLVKNGRSLDLQVSARIWTLVYANAIGTQLSADSPFYEDTQVQIPQWQAYLKDLIQLQMASLIASLDLKPTLGVAIEQAQAISKDRPSRIYAQTLVAQWRKEVTSLAHRPYLARARQLSALGTKKGYEAAIAQASTIALGQPLRNEAQTIVADGRRQIQMLEDRPILDEAEKLAKKEKYSEAIEVANKIRSDRALYQQAQASIQSWLETQDRKVLNEAATLANKGKLTEAISTASQLGSGSPLYKEAQRKISDWTIARDGPPVRTPPAPVADSNPVYSNPVDHSSAPTYYEEPAPTYYEEPAPTYYEEPAPTYQEPAPTYYEEPAPTYQEPAPTYYEEPAPTYQEPAPTYYGEPASGPIPKKQILNP
jgi:hypothetical protein